MKQCSPFALSLTEQNRLPKRPTPLRIKTVYKVVVVVFHRQTPIEET